MRVTNWTLSDRLRRVSVSVPVVYAADPARVLGILKRHGSGVPEDADKARPGGAVHPGFVTTP